jgi:two-component system response regulator AlgR
MTPFRVLIVDDEGAARRRLASLCRELGEQVVGEAANGLEALERIVELRPNLVLLDIEMPEVDGLDVARRLDEPRPFIVFATAYDQYALEAFEHEALDFVIKPVARERLARVFERARRRMPQAESSPFSMALVEQVRAALGRTIMRRPRRLLVRYRDGHRLVALSSIHRFRAEGGAVTAATASGEFLMDESLDELQARLEGVFVRTSRADLLAVDHVDRIASNGDGSATVTTVDGATWRVSRRRSAGVREALDR